MNEDRYVILNPEGRAHDEVLSFDEAPVYLAGLNRIVEENNPYDAAFYTAHRIDPVPTVFETREEKLERLVDMACYINTPEATVARLDEIDRFARELRDSRPKGEQ